MLHETFDRAALTGRVAALEQDDDLFAVVLDPFLYLQQFDLQLRLFFFVFERLILSV